MKKLLKRFFAMIMAFLFTVCSQNYAFGIYQNDANVFTKVVTDQKFVALTFDDGPHPRYTEEILDILDQYGIKATFFVIGKNAVLYDDVFRKCVQKGHEIGNHTYSHKSAKNCVYEELKKEALHTNSIIEGITHKKTALFRPPTGFYNENCLRLSRELGFNTVLWNIDTRDWAHTPADKIVSNIKRNVKNGSIILFHDYVTYPSPTPCALSAIIPFLISRGYRFLTVSELIELNN